MLARSSIAASDAAGVVSLPDEPDILDDAAKSSKDDGDFCFYQDNVQTSCLLPISISNGVQNSPRTIYEMMTRVCAYLFVPLTLAETPDSINV
jgi:hypothetical protein